MKNDIHPKYKQLTITCVCGNTIETGSVKDAIKVEICNACHPFYAGTQKIVDTEGRVDRFKKRYSEQPAQVKSAKKIKMEQKLKEEAAKKALEEQKEKEKREASKKAKLEAKAKAKARAEQAEQLKKQKEEEMQAKIESSKEQTEEPAVEAVGASTEETKTQEEDNKSEVNS